MRATWVILSICLALAGAMGCGRSPAVRYFALPSMLAPESPTAQAATALVVGPIDLPGYLERREIARRNGSGRVEYDEWNRWADRLDSELLRVLADQLAGLLGTARVVEYPDESPYDDSYRVQVQVLELGPQPSDGSVILRARWQLSGGPDDVRRAATFRAERPRVSDAEDLVEAHGELVEEFARSIADRIAMLAR